MLRRLFALALWVYFGWYLTAMLVDLVALPAALGPLGGALTGFAALIDWQRGQVRVPPARASAAPVAGTTGSAAPRS